MNKALLSFLFLFFSSLGVHAESDPNVVYPPARPEPLNLYQMEAYFKYGIIPVDGGYWEVATAPGYKNLNKKEYRHLVDILKSTKDYLRTSYKNIVHNYFKTVPDAYQDGVDTCKRMYGRGVCQIGQDIKDYCQKMKDINPDDFGSWGAYFFGTLSSAAKICMRPFFTLSAPFIGTGKALLHGAFTITTDVLGTATYQTMYTAKYGVETVGYHLPAILFIPTVGQAWNGVNFLITLTRKFPSANDNKYHLIIRFVEGEAPELKELAAKNLATLP